MAILKTSDNSEEMGLFWVKYSLHVGCLMVFELQVVCVPVSQQKGYLGCVSKATCSRNYHSTDPSRGFFLLSAGDTEPHRVNDSTPVIPLRLLKDAHAHSVDEEKTPHLHEFGKNQNWKMWWFVLGIVVTIRWSGPFSNAPTPTRMALSAALKLSNLLNAQAWAPIKLASSACLLGVVRDNRGVDQMCCRCSAAAVWEQQIW